MSSPSQLSAFLTAMDHARLVTNFNRMDASCFVGTIADSIASTVSALMILIYNHILTFAEEFDLFWKSRLNVVNVLFFVTRYAPFVDMAITIWHQLGSELSSGQCLFAYRFTTWLIQWGINATEIVLMWRAWAVWGKDRKIGIIIVLWYISVTVPLVVLEALFLDSLEFTPLPKPWLGCLPTGGRKEMLSMAWIVLLICELGLLSLMVIKAIQMHKFHGNTALYRAVYRNGSLFYVALCALSTINVTVIFVTPADLIAILNSFERVLHSVLAGWILIEMRQVGKKNTIVSDAAGLDPWKSSMELSEDRHGHRGGGSNRIGSRS